MRIDPNNLPLHIAKAYGVRTARPAAPAQSSTPAAPIRPNTGTDQFVTSSPVQRLVAGRVPGQVDFNAAPPASPKPAGESQVFQLYTRAADKVEAAIAVQVGRTLDVKG